MNECAFTVVTALPGPLARIVQGALETEGIPTRLDREASGAVYGLDTGLAATRVLVPTEYLEDARTLIATIEDGA